MKWSGRSSDLTPIDYSLGHLHSEVVTNFLSSLDQLKNCHEEIVAVTENTFCVVLKHFFYRLQEYQRNNGTHFEAQFKKKRISINFILSHNFQFLLILLFYYRFFISKNNLGTPYINQYKYVIV